MLDLVPWRHVVVDVRSGDRLTYEVLVGCFRGEVPGIRIPGFYDQPELEAVLTCIEKRVESARDYQAIDLGTVYGVPSHWEFEYTEGDWDSYWGKADAGEAMRREDFSSVGDPVGTWTALLSAAWPQDVVRARHPSTGRMLYAGLVRSGAPLLHFDRAPFDFPDFGRDVAWQLGINIILREGGCGGDLRVYRQLGMAPGNTADSGESPVGNYGLSERLVEGIPSDDIPCRAGDLVITGNFFLHEVTPCTMPSRRLTVSTHAVWLRDGTIALFS